ncbi:MAG TPA: sulfotransferase [Desulfobacteraceae bacterium]|nr:sulfotransferase [Desulfobacteraceae bacterium]HPJ66390.1 sulfotransferase [Desulfobacteraceae bacterium]HPQ27312.1 sulfotransferase [Desulfobacteraceae bacterium]
MTGNIKGRVFLVGCPRSGTTLLQSLLAAHPQIASFPETHLLVSTGRTWRGRILTKLSIVSPEMCRQFESFLDKTGNSRMKNDLPRRPFFIRQYVTAAINTLDTIALEHDSSYWLEKTPGHLHYLSFIESCVPGARFIHLLRNGEDVVASLYAVTHEFPELWGGIYDINRCIQRWNKDVQISFKYKDKNNHLLVKYESMVRDTSTVIEKICRFLGIEVQEEMLWKYSEVAEKLINEDEVWKRNVMEPISSDLSGSYKEVLSESQREYVENNLVKLIFDI